MNCDNPRSTEERSACSCLESVKLLSKVYALYEKNLEDDAKNSATYLREWNDYLTRLREWEARRQNKRSELENEKRGVNNCVSGNQCDSNKDIWCESDIATGWIHRGCDNCGLLRRVTCIRGNSLVEAELRNFEINDPKPNPPSGGSNGVAAPCGDSCQPPSNNTILCCSQHVSDITAGKDVNINNVQNCSQKITQQFNNFTPTVTPVVTPTVTPDNTDVVPVITPGNTPNYSVVFLIIVIIIIVILIVISYF